MLQLARHLTAMDHDKLRAEAGRIQQLVGPMGGSHIS